MVGREALRLKVSEDGTTLHQDVQLDPATGAASFRASLKYHISGYAVSNRIPIAGGDGVVSAFRYDPARAENPRIAKLSRVSGDALTRTAALTTGSTESSVDFTPNESGGSFLSTRGHAGQKFAASQFTLATAALSPVSDSNLLLVR